MSISVSVPSAPDPRLCATVIVWSPEANRTKGVAWMVMSYSSRLPLKMAMLFIAVPLKSRLAPVPPSSVSSPPPPERISGVLLQPPCS